MRSTARCGVWTLSKKVTGQAMYGADLKFERMLYGKGLYAEHPHARIVSIDASEAEAMEGVACVVTARDIPGMKVMGEVMQDQYILADDKTRFFRRRGRLRRGGDAGACGRGRQAHPGRI